MFVRWGFLISAILFFCGCWQQRLPRSFRYCLEGSPSSFNPQTAIDGDTFDASSQTIYNRLIDFKPGTTLLRPSLAKDWKILENGTRIRFYLRKDVTFHSNEIFTPTRNFNAEDVLFSFKRMRDTNHPYHSIGNAEYRYFNSLGMGNVLEDIKKVSDYVVDFKLRKNDASFLSNLAMDFASILSKEYATALAATDQKKLLDFKPIGTGPFKFEQYIEGSKIFYKNNENYFSTDVKIENLIFKMVPDGNDRVDYLLEGTCDFIKSPPLERISALLSKDKVKVAESHALNVSYLAMNTELEIFKDPDIRQALAKALNRKEYVERVYSDRAEVAELPLPRETWAYDGSLSPIDYDKKKARKTIKKKFKDKSMKRLELWVLPIARPYLPNGRLLGEYIKNDLSDVGVDVSLVTYDWITFLDKVSKGEHEMVLYGWTGDNGDPDNFLSNLLSCTASKNGNNLSRFCDTQFDSALIKAKSVTDVALRKKHYSDALKIFKEKLPLVPIAHSKIYKVMDKHVKNYTPTPFGTESFDKVYMSDWEKE